MSPERRDDRDAGREDDLDRARFLLGDLGMASSGSGTVEDEDTLGLIFRISREIHGSLDVREILPRILELAMEHAAAERGVVFYFDPKSGESIPWVVRGLTPEESAEAEQYSRTIVDHARAQLVHSPDAAADPRFADVESVRLNRIRSMICVPIVSSRRALGALYLDNQVSSSRFTERQVRFVGVVAQLAAIALDHGELYRELIAENDRLQQQRAPGTFLFDEIIGRSRPMKELLRNLERVARTEFPVLLVGESGTGKELVARAVHRTGPRAGGPFIAQNCAAVPAELLESEFFGHVRGAFTGAHADRAGLFSLADGGTLFLDEIADLDPRLQAKLLRVIEDGTIRPVGSGTEIATSVRLLSATSADLLGAVRAGRFRQDLYYRLNAVTLRIPPLRERTADIPVLLQHFLSKYERSVGGRRVTFTASALRELQKRPWRGNVRELEHFVQRVLVLVDRPVVDVDALERIFDPADADGTPIDLPIGTMSLLEIEQWAIREALRRTDGNRARAAELLGLHRNALLRRLSKMGDPDSGNER